MTCLDCKNSYLEISQKQPQEQDCLLHHITQFKNAENTNRPSLSNKAMYTLHISITRPSLPRGTRVSVAPTVSVYGW